MSEYVSYLKIVDHLDIQEGDTVLIGSDITLLAFYAMRNGEKLDLNLFINSMIKKIGQSGTLLFPTFNWDFCSGKVFDYNKTPSETGALTNVALKRNDFTRTKHPIYSFAVWGNDQNMLFEMDNKSSFGPDSPFAYLHHNKAKMLTIGQGPQYSFTFGHYVEESEKVSYRYMKDFTGDYIDHKGNIDQRTYSMYVRDIKKGVVTNLNPIREEMGKKGVSTLKQINNVNFYLIDLYNAYSVIQDDIQNNQAKKLYIIEKKQA
ncbi:AAC(3) family N-acetyltransferase [Metabacillus arenae]|uniref:Aminoglycoside N(3)-acetyltransferase n=1 Tax=Metabacillus arenae TaxID=2771434 RepID=A0A926NEB8_9BACI|nr:AAC(3) family N-acetyltransferase [Metabacillus arenae]MBD1381929.1 AAC(3) family N-acetyltransferase [Metabacillus arenae]